MDVWKKFIKKTDFDNNSRWAGLEIIILESINLLKNFKDY